MFTRLPSLSALGLFAVVLIHPAVIHSAMAADAPAKGKSAYKTDKERIGYTVGYQTGTNMRARDLDVDAAATAQGIRDALSSQAARLNPDEMKTAIEKLQKIQVDKLGAKAFKAMETGKKFLEDNKKNEGVVTTPSGLQYKVLRAGDGRSPKTGDKVTAHYRGTLIDGTEFDSSYARNEAMTFALDGVIKGWQEALPLMKTGAKWQVFIPSELAYGTRGAGGAIGPNEALIFDIELISVADGEAASGDAARK